eukprot:TRINITY_DN86_c0_g1_i2.p1 TRINITY_DN86_c0_g1~~TRINITY_DN86_c0_g1_i2.p1  ORF type:complete len:1492 (-),score=517.32 TRINITY_DN86_c0_g1_i2:58-4485(-)
MDSPFAPADESSTPRGGTTPRANTATQGQQQTQQTAQQTNTTQAQQQQGDQQQQYDYSQYYYGGGQTDASGQVDYQSYYYQGQTENGGYYYDPNQQYDYSQYYYGQEYAYGEEQAQQGYDAFQQIQQEVEAAQQQLQNTNVSTNATQQTQHAQAHTPAATSVTPQYQQPVQPVVPVEDPKIKLFARVSTQNEEELKDEFPRVGIVDFYEKDSDANIRYEDPGQRIIAAATLPKLIEKLTSSQADIKLNADFILTFRGFTSSLELIGLLKKRFEQEPPSHLPPADLENLKNDLKVVRLKVLNTLKGWVEGVFFDWHNGELLRQLDAFIAMIFKYQLMNPANQLRAVMDKKLAEPEPPVTPREDGAAVTSILDHTAADWARQLTALDSQRWRACKPWEFLNKRWSTNNGQRATRSKHISEYIKATNRLSAWVTTDVVREENLDNRAKKITKFIEIAQELRNLRNFNSLMAIVSGLSAYSVSRLRKTWELVPMPLKSTFSDLVTLVNDNRSYKNLRAACGQAQGQPVLPYLGVLLFDVTRAEETAKPGLPDNFVGFTKYRAVAPIIKEITVMQNTTQVLPVAKTYEKFLEDVEHWDSDTLLKFSFFVEPPKTQSTTPPAKPAITTPKTELKVDEMTLELKDAAEEKNAGGVAGPTKVDLKSATLEQLVHTLLTVSDDVFQREFLLTFKSFVTMQDLLKVYTQELLNASDEMKLLDEGARRESVTIKRRISSTLMLLAQNYMELLVEDDVQQLRKWAEEELKKEIPEDAQKLVAAISGSKDGIQSSQSSSSLAGAPRPHIPMNIQGTPTVMDFHPQEVARQFSVNQFELFKQVNIPKLITRCCESAPKPVEASLVNTAAVASQIDLLVKAQENIENWVISEICNSKGPKEAAAVVTHFVQTIEYMLEINNFNTPAGIVNGLYAFAMNNIWELVEKKYKDTFDKAKGLFTDLISLKDKTASSPVPCLPFVGVISLEISKLQAAPDLAEGGLINFDKRKKLAGLIDMIKRHQKESYKFSKVAVIWEYISTYRPLDTQAAEDKMTVLDGEVAKKKKGMGQILGVFKKDKDKDKDKERKSPLSGAKLERRNSLIQAEFKSPKARMTSSPSSNSLGSSPVSNSPLNNSGGFSPLAPNGGAPSPFGQPNPNPGQGPFSNPTPQYGNPNSPPQGPHSAGGVPKFGYGMPKAGFNNVLGSPQGGNPPGPGQFKGQPGMGQPGMGQPGMGQPGQPKFGGPGMGQPGMQPGMGQPGQPGQGSVSPRPKGPGFGQPMPGMGQQGQSEQGAEQQQGQGQPPQPVPGGAQPNPYGLKSPFGAVKGPMGGMSNPNSPMRVGQPGLGQPGQPGPQAVQPKFGQSPPLGPSSPPYGQPNQQGTGSGHDTPDEHSSGSARGSISDAHGPTLSHSPSRGSMSSTNTDMINLQDENVRNLIKALAREELKRMIATEKTELIQNVQKEVAELFKKEFSELKELRKEVEKAREALKKIKK